MLRRITKVVPQNAIAAGQTAIYSLPLDRRYFKGILRYKTNANRSTIESDIEQIRVIVNDVEQRRMKASELLDINLIYGVPFSAGFLPLFFAEPWLRNLANENVTAWSMGDVSNFRIEVDIASGATAPALELSVEHDNPVDENGSLPNIGNLVKYFRRPVGVTSIGQRDVLDLPRDQGRLKAIHLFEGSSGDVDQLTLEVDQLKISDTRNVGELERFLLSQVSGDFDYGGHDSDVESLIMNPNGNMEDTLPLVKANGQRVSELLLTANMTAANDFVLIAEYFGQPA